jgi:hypothetical protein
MDSRKSSRVIVMNYTYKISEDVVMGFEVYELQDGKYHFHSTIFGLKDIIKTEEHFESKKQ